VEGEPSAKDMFLMVPTEETDTYGKMTYENKFGKPYGLDLMFQYNGRQDPIVAMIESVNIFIYNLNLMKEQFLQEKSDIIHSQTTEYSTKLTIPLNVDIDLLTHEDGKFKVLMDDGLLHAVSVKILEILDNIILDNIKLWEHVSVYYRVPHRLISQSELMCKIPESEDFNMLIKSKLKPGSKFTSSHILIELAINEVIQDLENIKHELEIV
jgi:hypothetical protein